MISKVWDTKSRNLRRTDNTMEKQQKDKRWSTQHYTQNPLNTIQLIKLSQSKGYIKFAYLSKKKLLFCSTLITFFKYTFVWLHPPPYDIQGTTDI